MFKHVKRVGAGVGIVGVPVMAFATHSIPETIRSADGTIYNNLKYLGIDRPPPSLATSAVDHTVAMVAAAMILFGALCALSWAWDWFRKGRDLPINKDGVVVSSLKAQAVDLSQGKVAPGGDAYVNNGTMSNSHMGPVHHHHGKQPFVMTASIIAAIASRLDKQQRVWVSGVGGEKSKSDANLVINNLRANGFDVEIGVWSSLAVPAPTVPWEVVGNTVNIAGEL